MGKIRHAVVVGGGIGGLCAAVGLHRAGWQVSVLEQAPAFGEIGAGLTLWPNALAAMRALGLADQALALTRPQRSGGLRRADGRWLSRWDGRQIEERLGNPMIGIHRAHLHQILLDALPPESLRTGVEVVTLADAGPAELIVAADGIDSGLRRQLWPDHPAPAYSGVTAWRGICAPPGDVDIAVTWGRGAEVGVVPLVDGRIYWYASLNRPAGIRHNDEKAFVRAEFGSWHAPIPDLIDATPANAVLHHDIYHLATPLPSYVSGRVALLGDAAHAMTPFLGQGGCQAVEDAAVLRAAVSRHSDIETALAFYDQQRRPRSQSVARASLRMARFSSGLGNPLLATLRDTVIRLTPTRMSVRGMANIADWTPPAVA
jgi:2-polyprenyl-6-methoxyphenol hydroxylase-like FAD-dependent oxidoreductase